MIIRPIKESDLPAIVEIASENSLANLSNEEVIKTGFLVSAFSESDYKKYLNNRYFFVAEENKEISAFLLAFTRQELDYTQMVNQEIREKTTDDFLVIKQVCVSRKFSRKGLGKQLYQYTIQNSGLSNYYAAIVYEPMNDTSVKFHLSLGFNELFTITPEDGLKRGIFFYQKAEPNEKQLKIKLEQYNQAIDLYKHEDRLNWLKFNNLIYLNAGIFTIIGFLLKQNADSVSSGNYPLILSLLPILGVIISFGLGQSICSGVRYLKDRKLKVVNIEKDLVIFGGYQVVQSNQLIYSKHKGKDDKRNHKKLENSATTLILKNIYWVFVVFWIAVELLVYFQKI